MLPDGRIMLTDNPELKVAQQNNRFLKQIAEALQVQVPTPERQPSVQATANDETPTNDVIANVDANRLGSFFNSKFKGCGNNYNYFDDMIKDIQTIRVSKELAMIAVMIYECKNYFIQKPSTFAAWLRVFFEIIGRDCPKDCHKNKYRPNERIKRTFYYLA